MNEDLWTCYDRDLREMEFAVQQKGWGQTRWEGVGMWRGWFGGMEVRKGTYLRGQTDGDGFCGGEKGIRTCKDECETGGFLKVHSSWAHCLGTLLGQIALHPNIIKARLIRSLFLFHTSRVLLIAEFPRQLLQAEPLVGLHSEICLPKIVNLVEYSGFS